MPKIELGIDQWSATMQPRPIVDAENGIFQDCNSDWWAMCCAGIPSEIADLLKLKEVFGVERMEIMTTKKTHGYDSGIMVENQDCAICWHSQFRYFSMGFNVRFGGKTWHEYCEKYEKKYGVLPNLPDMLKSLNKLHQTRLSRIDLTADFFDYPDLSPDIVNTGIDKKEIQVLAVKEKIKELPDGTEQIIKTNRKAYKEKTAFLHDKTAETVYIGSKKSPVFLCVYDKRIESIKNHGYRYQDAIKCKSWTRFEVRYHNDFAHKISNDFLAWQPTDNMAAYIAKRIDDKYHFSHTKKVEKIQFSEELRQIAMGCKFGILSKPRPKDNDLERSRNYIIKFSGLLSWLYKIARVYGYDADKKALDWIFEYYEREIASSYIDNPEMNDWLKKHLKSAKQIDFEDIFPPDFEIAI